MKKTCYLPLCFLWFSAGCGGGGTGVTQQEIVTFVQATEPEIAYIFGRLQSFEGGTASAYAIDVNSGALTIIDPESDLFSFLSKQPALIDENILLPNGQDSYSALTHLYHDLGQKPQNQRSLSLVNQGDPGHFFLWGMQGGAPSAPQNYELQTLWFCGDCHVNFGQDSAILSIDGHQASLSMTTDERHLTLPLSLQDEGLFHNDNAPELISVPDNDPLPLSQWQAHGGFFGPEAQEAGLIFSLFYGQSVFSAAGIGSQTD